jgi:hypothetical protein
VRRSRIVTEKIVVCGRYDFFLFSCVFLSEKWMFTISLFP